MRTGMIARVAATATGTLLLAGVSTAALADEEHDTGEVSVGVEITENGSAGVLALSVASASTTLTEDGSTDLVRQFTGTLPTVTVTDTRSADEIAEGAAWYVLGSATDFVGDADQPPIGAGNFGWAPALVDGGESGLVDVGDPVETVLDDGSDAVGLVDQELLASTWSSSEVSPEGTWSVNAELYLRTPADVAAGQYTSTLTLSLFE